MSEVQQALANTDQRLSGLAGARGSDSFSPGQLVWWHCTPRGGWCIPFWVRARVVKTGKSRVTIAAELKNGGERETAVKPENLRPR